jgi:hypothetical protein
MDLSLKNNDVKSVFSKIKFNSIPINKNKSLINNKIIYKRQS